MKKPSRRKFLQLTGIGIAGSMLPGKIAYGQFSEWNHENEMPFELGLASYSLRKFSLDETLQMCTRLGLKYIALKSMHLPLDSNEAHIKDAVSKVKKAGLNLYGAGVIYMANKEEVNRAFEYAKTAGLKVIIGVPEHNLLQLVEEKVKAYDIKLAIHNHGPGDKRYPSPESAYEKIKNMDSRMGLCLDIGHTKRIGIDPAKAARQFMDRLHDVHIKDVDKAAAEGQTVEIGRGVIDIPPFLKVLIERRYSGKVSFEFEKDADDPLPGLAESVGYVRGCLDMIG
jgi:sugar phosphate isomerase/epimerase